MMSRIVGNVTSSRGVEHKKSLILRQLRLVTRPHSRTKFLNNVDTFWKPNQTQPILDNGLGFMWMGRRNWPLSCNAWPSMLHPTCTYTISLCLSQYNVSRLAPTPNALGNGKTPHVIWLVSFMKLKSCILPEVLRRKGKRKKSSSSRVRQPLLNGTLTVRDGCRDTTFLTIPLSLEEILLSTRSRKPRARQIKGRAISWETTSFTGLKCGIMGYALVWQRSCDHVVHLA